MCQPLGRVDRPRSDDATDDDYDDMLMEHERFVSEAAQAATKATLDEEEEDER